MEVLYKNVFAKIFYKITRKHLCQSHFLKKELQRKCFPVSFTKFVRASFYNNTSGRLLLLIDTFFDICNN